MNQDSFYRLLKVDALMNQVYEQLSIVANEESDGRYRGMITQAYGLKQDVEDKMREDLIDDKQQIASAPNLPNQNSTAVNNNQGNGNNQPISQNPVTQQNNGGQQNSNNGVSQNPTAPNQNNNANGQNVIPTDVTQFFNDLLAGKAGNNQDLNDLLNQMNQTQSQAAPSNNNAAPF